MNSDVAVFWVVKNVFSTFNYLFAKFTNLDVFGTSNMYSKNNIPTLPKVLKKPAKTLLLFRQGYKFTVIFLQRQFIKDLEGFLHGIINFKKLR